MLEYYDFFLYGLVAVLILGPQYFPTAARGSQTLWAVASVGAGYVARVAGALVLGHVGDVHGRQPVFCLTLLLMGTATTLIGMLPTYQDIGMAAPVLLVCLRLLQGFAVSAEQAGAHALILELSPPGRRGLYTSFAVSGTQAGFILASAVLLLLSSFLSDTELRAWGWRIPFLLSAVLVGVGLWTRLHLSESSAFLSERGRQRGRPEPLKTLWKQHKVDVLRVVLIAQFSVVSSIVAVFSLSWAVSRSKLSMPAMLAVLMASAVVGMLAAPLWARLSDRVGRRPVFNFGVLASSVFIGPYLWAIDASSVSLVLVFGIFLAGVAYNAALGVWPSLCAEIFGTSVRLSGVAIGTQLGFMLSAQAPTLAAVLTGNVRAGWAPVALLVGASCAISALTVFVSRETNLAPMADLGRSSVRWHLARGRAKER